MENEKQINLVSHQFSIIDKTITVATLKIK